MPKTKDKVEELIKQKSTISNKALKAALTKREKQLEEEQSERILDQLNTIGRNMDRQVEAIRKIRKTENEFKNGIKKLNDAEQEFKKTADYETYKKVADQIKKELQKTREELVKFFTYLY